MEAVKGKDVVAGGQPFEVSRSRQDVYQCTSILLLSIVDFKLRVLRLSGRMEECRDGLGAFAQASELMMEG
jgi:hypothetical protein